MLYTSIRNQNRKMVGRMGDVIEAWREIAMLARMDDVMEAWIQTPIVGILMT